jgi:hypothetical protein
MSRSVPGMGPPGPGRSEYPLAARPGMSTSRTGNDVSRRPSGRTMRRSSSRSSVPPVARSIIMPTSV